MSDDIRAKAQKVWDECQARSITDTTLAQFANYVLATEARLDVALRGAMQSREEMREWLTESGDAIDAVTEALVGRTDMKPGARVVLGILHALADVMPGSDA